MSRIKNLLIVSAFAILCLNSNPLSANALEQFNVYLGFGSTNNNAVYKLQEFLVNQGYLKTTPTGNYLSLTRDAVKAFQIANNISNTGYFGPLTAGAANKILLSSTESTNNNKAQVNTSPVTNSANAASVILSNSKTISWQTNKYPAQVGININLLRKVSSNPLSYTLVRQIATDAPNNGSYSWIPNPGETGNDLYLEVTCSTSHNFGSGCNLGSTPVKAY